MSTEVANKLKPIPVSEQRLLLPGRHSWQQFKVLEAVVNAEYPGVRLFYLDGYVELMTLSPEHEIIKSILGLLLGAFFEEMGIDFIPLGSATLQAEAKGGSVEPDLSYAFGDKIVPDLAIEVVITSGGLEKLPCYLRFGVPEVWFWQNEKFTLYCLQGDDYEEASQSRILPDLDLNLLTRCVLMPSKLEAVREFRRAIRG